MRIFSLVMVVIAVGIGAVSFAPAAEGQTTTSASAGIEWASAGILATGVLVMFIWPRRRKQTEDTDR